MFATLLSVLAPIPHIDVQQQSQTSHHRAQGSWASCRKVTDVLTNEIPDIWHCAQPKNGLGSGSVHNFRESVYKVAQFLVDLLEQPHTGSISAAAASPCPASIPVMQTINLDWVELGAGKGGTSKRIAPSFAECPTTSCYPHQANRYEFCQLAAHYAQMCHKHFSRQQGVSESSSWLIVTSAPMRSSRDRVSAGRLTVRSRPRAATVS
jgi:hypothetical protein